MKVQASRKLTFETGHRVYKHESACKNMHGHSYKLFLYAEAEHLDSVGRVIDFKVLKTKFLPWIEDNWDHAFIWFDKDYAMEEMFVGGPLSLLKNWKAPFNPTAENMAIFILNELGPRLLQNTGVTITKVELHETENCKVEVSL